MRLCRGSHQDKYSTSLTAARYAMGCLEPLLHEHGLASHQAVLTARGLHCVEDLAQLNEVDVDYLRDALVENGADGIASRRFLRAAKPTAMLNEDCIHFYRLAERINSTDVSGLEESTILKIDIYPFNEHAARLHVPANILSRLTQTSSTDPMPVVSLLGPTGSGKSFVASTFLQSKDGVLPLVASPDQHVPTSVHVCVHRAAIHSGSRKSRPILLFDYEGEDGRVPKTLLEVGMRRLDVLRKIGLTEAALQQQLEATAARRQEVIKERLPPMAYLLSDVVVFIDTVEPRRTERVDRIRRFAEQAHQSVNSMAWKPALILVQNKWMRETESAAFNVSDELDWLQANLAAIFSSVSVLRIAHVSQHHWFEASLNEFHNELLRMVDEVHHFRQEQGVLFSERDLWCSFKPMVTQFSDPGQLKKNLADFVSRDLVSMNAAENALCAFKRLQGTAPSPDPVKFHRIVEHVLLRYAYSLAGEARRDGIDVESSKQRMHAIYEKAVGFLAGEEPCSANLCHDMDGKTYCCTQLRTGHTHMHRNPALIPVQSENFFLRLFFFGFWQDWKPCVWQGDFETATEMAPSYEKIEEAFLDFLTQDVSAYLKSSRLAPFDEDQPESLEQFDICSLCLRADSEQVCLKHRECRHFLCRKCLLTRMMLLGPDNRTIVCPFCHKESDGQAHSSHDERNGKGFRILSLDGGGVRGLIEVLVLKRLEEVFDPLPITSLFDLIVGTSAGGLVSMALLTGVSLSTLEGKLQNLAEVFFSVNRFQNAWHILTKMSIHCTDSLGEVLKHILGDKNMAEFRGDRPPYIFWVACDVETIEPVVIGNYPRHFEGTKSLTAWKVSPWYAGLCTAAVPGFFDPVDANQGVKTLRENDAETKEFQQRKMADGGIVANCPAALGVKVAGALHVGSKGFDDIHVESIASIGTGLPEPSVVVTDMNLLTWAMKVIDIATDSEKQWKEGIEERAELQSTPRVRVNPPKLGSLAAFQSTSIPKLQKGMEEYFASELGKQQMGKLVHMTYAKLWEVKQALSLVAGGPGVKFSIVMQDHRCDFHSLEIVKLKEIICKRRQGLEENHLQGNSEDELCRMAKEAFESKPFLFDFQGTFGYRFAGVEYELADGQMEFNLEHHKAGAPELDVFWRSVHGDISLSGLPRTVRVSE